MNNETPDMLDEIWADEAGSYSGSKCGFYEHKYLRADTPTDNSEALEALDRLNLYAFSDDEQKTKWNKEAYETIRQALSQPVGEATYCPHCDCTLSQPVQGEWCDLMVDEFHRIKSLFHGEKDVRAREVTQLCERAITNTKQRIPLIQQRDDFEQEAVSLRVKLSELQAQPPSNNTAVRELAEALETITHYEDGEGGASFFECSSWALPDYYKKLGLWSAQDVAKHVLTKHTKAIEGAKADEE